MVTLSPPDWLPFCPIISFICCAVRTRDAPAGMITSGLPRSAMVEACPADNWPPCSRAERILAILASPAATAVAAATGARKGPTTGIAAVDLYASIAEVYVAIVAWAIANALYAVDASPNAVLALAAISPKELPKASARFVAYCSLIALSAAWYCSSLISPCSRYLSATASFCCSWMSRSSNSVAF